MKSNSFHSIIDRVNVDIYLILLLTIICSNLQHMVKIDKKAQIQRTTLCLLRFQDRASKCVFLLGKN